MTSNSIATAPFARLSETPTLFIVGEHDDVVGSEPQRADFERLCGQGWRPTYLECAGADHGDGAVWSLPDQAAWLEAVLAGTTTDATVCQRVAPVRCSGQE